MQLNKAFVMAIVLISIMLPSAAYAESSDKLPSLVIMIFFSAMTAAFLFFSYKVSWWFPMALTPLSLFFLSGVKDVVVGTDILQAASVEIDGLYKVLLGLGVVAIVLCHGMGIWRGVKSLKHPEGS